MEPTSSCGADGEDGPGGAHARWFLFLYVMLALMLSGAAVTIVKRRRVGGGGGGGGVGGYGRAPRHNASPSGRNVEFFGAVPSRR